MKIPLYTAEELSRILTAAACGQLGTAAADDNDDLGVDNGEGVVCLEQAALGRNDYENDTGVCHARVHAYDEARFKGGFGARSKHSDRLYEKTQDPEFMLQWLEAHKLA